MTFLLLFVLIILLLRFYPIILAILFLPLLGIYMGYRTLRNGQPFMGYVIIAVWSLLALLWPVLLFG